MRAIYRLLSMSFVPTNVCSVRSASIPRKRESTTFTRLTSLHAPRPHSLPHSAHLRHPSSNSSTLTPPLTPPGQRTPTIATPTPTSPAIKLIRETFYAAVADVLTSTPSLLRSSNPTHPAQISAPSHSPFSLSPLLHPTLLRPRPAPTTRTSSWACAVFRSRWPIAQRHCAN